MKRIRGIAAAIMMAAIVVATAGAHEVRANDAAQGGTAAGPWGSVLGALAIARHFVSNGFTEEPPSSALPVTSWGQIKDKYRDPVGPIKN